MSELEFWRSLALYLADCHAATAEGLGSRASKRERERHRKICQQAHDAILGGACDANLSRYWDGRVDDWVLNRLREASSEPRYQLTDAGRTEADRMRAAMNGKLGGKAKAGEP